MKTQFYANLSNDDQNDLILETEIAFNISAIHSFINLPTPLKPLTPIEKHNNLVELYNRVQIIVNAITNYETQNSKNTNSHLESN